jgi:hypothetical protein
MKRSELVNQAAKILEGRGKKKLARATAKLKTQGSLKGTYADYMYAGDELFLKEAMKGIRKLAGKKASVLKVVRKGGRAPFLTFEGEDKSDMSLDFTIQVFSTSVSDVTLDWFGNSVLRGRINGDMSYKAGMLKPQAVVDTFREYFGR